MVVSEWVESRITMESATRVEIVAGHPISCVSATMDGRAAAAKAFSP